MARTYHLYRHFDKEGALLYVGVSLEVLRRQIAHRTLSGWFGEIASLEPFATLAAALDAEMRAIKTETPRGHNVKRNRSEIASRPSAKVVA
jgi:hypothetical protein